MGCFLQADDVELMPGDEGFDARGAAGPVVGWLVHGAADIEGRQADARAVISQRRQDAEAEHYCQEAARCGQQGHFSRSSFLAISWFIVGKTISCLGFFASNQRRIDRGGDGAPGSCGCALFRAAASASVRSGRGDGQEFAEDGAGVVFGPLGAGRADLGGEPWRALAPEAAEGEEIAGGSIG